MSEKALYIRKSSFKKELFRDVGIVWALVVRDVKGQYRRSILGPAWAIIQPVFYMIIFTFIRGVVKISSEGVPYAIFTFSALVPWSFFSNAVTRCAPSIYTNAGIVKKIGIPKELFPIASVITSLLDFVISSIILIGMMIWFRVPIGLPLLLIPVLVFMIFLLALGVGFGMAALGTYKRDIIFGVPFLMQFWLLVTPIMYPLSSVSSKWKTIYLMNPMVGVIEGFRAIIVKNSFPDPLLLLYSTISLFVIWGLLWPFFRYVAQYFSDVL